MDDISADFRDMFTRNHCSIRPRTEGLKSIKGFLGTTSAVDAAKWVRDNVFAKSSTMRNVARLDALNEELYEAFEPYGYWGLLAVPLHTKDCCLRRFRLGGSASPTLLGM